MEKLVVVVMGQDCEKFIPMCLESVKDADAIVHCDGGSTDKSIPIVDNFFMSLSKDENCIIENTYDQDDPKMNGKQRNFYLDYIKKNYPDHWCLCLDADEVVDTDGIKKIKDFINFIPKEDHDVLFSPKMRHFISDLGHEDSTQDAHFVQHRLFKIRDELRYPEVEHPILGHEGKMRMNNLIITTIWHLAYAPNLWDIKKRYECHMKKSNMHTPEYLKNWYFAHLFGEYPKTKINPIDLPKAIFNEFGIDKDEIYFHHRGLELKHPEMVKQWNDYFKPESILDLGCGKGCYLKYWHWFTDATGIELSKWAVSHAFTDNIWEENIITETLTEKKNYDLITFIDILEHLNSEDLNIVLKKYSKKGNKFLFSIPFKGDPNLLNDKTHIQIKTKEEWIKLIKSNNIKILKTPSTWLFSEQILIGEKYGK